MLTISSKRWISLGWLAALTAGLTTGCVSRAGHTNPHATGDPARMQRVRLVTETPGLVAFWDFVKRERDGRHRFAAHVPADSPGEYELDVDNYVREYWGRGRPAAYSDFPLMGRGPFGQAIRVRHETDPTFRPYLLVPRSRLHDTPLDIKGKGRSVSVVVWAIRESGNHALAGIWHEGTDLRQQSTEGIQRAVRGQRQYALFAGLAKPGSACGHVSENGESSFNYKYAGHKSHSAHAAPELPADATPDQRDASWHCFAMTFDHDRNEITGWLDGIAATRWETRLESGMMRHVRNAWRQGHRARQPGGQAGEIPRYPAAQFYNPPEETPLNVRTLGETPDGNVELHEFRYTKVEVVYKRTGDGKRRVVRRDLAAVRLNPWWYPHDIYAPRDDETGGPFTIGRAIHSARLSGFSGWIGGVAVYNRALTAHEVMKLARIARRPPLAAPSSRSFGSWSEAADHPR